MRSRFDEQLALLNKEMIEMGALCEKVISLAVDALENGDSEAASKVSPFDSEIDEKERTIEALCLKLLLQHSGSSSHSPYRKQGLPGRGKLAFGRPMLAYGLMTARFHTLS